MTSDDVIAQVISIASEYGASSRQAIAAIMAILDNGDISQNQRNTLRQKVEYKVHKAYFGY